jgi:mRNA interferase RelE/StbE
VAYVIDYLAPVIKKDIPALSASARKRIKNAIEERLAHDPIAFGKPLRYGFYGQRSLRVGDYRVLYTVDYPQQIVTIHAIGHRRDIYDA